MGNQQKSEDVPEDTQIPEESKDLNPSAEDNANIEKKNEEPKLDPKDDLNKEPEIKNDEKYPHDNPRHSKLDLENQKLSETKIIFNNTKDQNSQDNKESNKEATFTFSIYDKELKSLVNSNGLKNTDLEQYIKKKQEINNQKLNTIIEENQNNVEMKRIDTKKNIEDLNINDDQNEEVHYTDNNLNINNMDNNNQKEESYTFNNLDLKNAQQKEIDYTFNGNIFQSGNNIKEKDYSCNAQIFTNTDINNLNIEQNYDNNNIISNDDNNVITNEYTDNINIVEDNNYITPTTNNEENINYSKVLPIQYLPSKVENIETNTNDIDNINFDINNNIDTNNIQVTEYNQRLNAENIENHFSESKNIYDQRPQEEVQKESHFSEAQNIYEQKAQEEAQKGNHFSESQNIYDQKAQEEAQKGNHFSESQNIYDQKAQEEAQKENQIEDNNNNDNIINDPFIFNTVNQTQNIDIKESNNSDVDNNKKTKLFEELHESKTLFIKNKDKSITQENEPGNEMANDNLNNIKEEEQNINNKNKDDNDSEEIRFDNNNNYTENKKDDKLDISAQIKEINEKPDSAFEQREKIFNEKQIKVIKIEEEETQFCANLFSPLYKKLFG